MPVENGEYVQLSESEITSALESELRNEFGRDIDLTESSVFSTLASVWAKVLQSNQEQSLQDVYESAFLDTATGDDLDKVVSIIGIRRRPAIHATGVQKFLSNGPVGSDYTIQRGTTVQTPSDDPVEFETTEEVSLQYIDGFEGDLSSYVGDTTSASISSTHPHEGSGELQLDATSGAHIYNEDVLLQEGTTFHFDVYAETDTVPTVTLGVQDSNNYYQVVFDTFNGEIRIEKIVSGSLDTTIDTVVTTIPTGAYFHAEVGWSSTGNLTVDATDSSGNTIGTAGGEDTATDRWHDGYVGFKSGDATASKYFDEATTSAVTANVRCVNGGTRGNVGANSVDTMPSPPAGVSDTTNPYPIGDTDYNDTDGTVFVVGQEEETDSELRERAKTSVAEGGDATHDALVSTLLNDVENVSSVTIYENKTNNDNTGTGGLPEYSFEAVVFGGDSDDIANAIFKKKAVTARDYGGANGTGVTRTVTAETNGQQFDIDFSRPNTVSIDMSMDIVVDDTYIGDDALKDRIIEYVGGTLSDGTSPIGLEVGENVNIDTVERITTADDTGVVGFDQSASADEITTTPSKTTTTSGFEVVSIGSNEVAQINSITLNKTQI